MAEVVVQELPLGIALDATLRVSYAPGSSELLVAAPASVFPMNREAAARLRDFLDHWIAEPTPAATALPPPQSSRP